MNPFVRDQIQTLRASGDPQAQAQATILEVLSVQDEKLERIEIQTTKTNGRVTALEKKVEATVSCPGKCNILEEKVAEIEKPFKKASIIWGAVVSIVSALVVAAGLLLAFLESPLGDIISEGRDRAITEAVEKALREHTKP